MSLLSLGLSAILPLPDVLTLLENLFTGPAGSSIVETIKDKTLQKRAIHETARAFERTMGVREALTRWSQTSSYELFILDLQQGQLDVVEDRCITSFIEEGAFTSGYGAKRRERADKVLARFFMVLLKHYFKSKEGMRIFQLRNEFLHAETLALLNRLFRLLDKSPHKAGITLYLNTLISKTDTLNLADVDAMHLPKTDKITLADVFIPLYLTYPLHLPQPPLSDALMSRRSDSPIEADAPASVADSISAISEIAQQFRLVITGEPGAGKTSLVNQVVTQLALRYLGQPGSEEGLLGWPEHLLLLPVRIVVRHFAAWLRGRPHTDDGGLVWDYLADCFREWGCGEAFIPVKEILIEQGGLVFFDGLDEVTHSDSSGLRSTIKEAILAFAQPLEMTKVVVTCRTYAYWDASPATESWRLPRDIFQTVTLAAFDRQQVKAFARRWYHIVGRRKRWSRQQCEQAAATLCQAIADNEYLRQLAHTPLLLTLMAQIHAQPGQLPRDRAELYSRVAHLLLAHWENRIVQDIRNVDETDPDQVLAIQASLAEVHSALAEAIYHAYNQQSRNSHSPNGTSNVLLEDLQDVFYTRTGSYDKARATITYLEKRAGLLKPRGKKAFALPHKSFHESLAAAYLVEQSNFMDLLYGHLKDDFYWWREVFLLAALSAARDKPYALPAFIDMLVPRIENSALEAQRLPHLRLAAQILWESRFLDYVQGEQRRRPGLATEIYARVQAQLLAVLRNDTSFPPPVRNLAGKDLARLGDPREGVLTIKYMPFCYIPAGRFMVEHAPPEHPYLDLDYDYWMMQYPVTQAQYQIFMQESHDKEDRAICHEYNEPWSLANHPAICVSAHDAQTFTTWLTGKLHAQNRLPRNWTASLPSEDEWEKAARGGLKIPATILQTHRDFASPNVPIDLVDNPLPHRPYPWGKEVNSNLANVQQTGIETTSAVGCFSEGVSPYGIEDLAGNVWEWTRSQWTHLSDPVLQRNVPYSEGDRVLRGGAFHCESTHACCRHRCPQHPKHRSTYVGFRVVLRPEFSL